MLLLRVCASDIFVFTENNVLQILCLSLRALFYEKCSDGTSLGRDQQCTDI